MGLGLGPLRTVFIVMAALLFLLGLISEGSSASSEKLGEPSFNLFGKEEVLDVEESVQTSLKAVANLWTVYLPQVLVQSNSNSHYNLSKVCRKSAMNILYYDSTSYKNITIPGPRTIPLIDATGKQGAGLLTGNVMWDGSLDECFNYNYTDYCVASTVFPSPELVNNTHAPKELTWTVGLCVPKGCNASDISHLINETEVLQSKQDTIRCLSSKMPSYNTGAKIMMTVTGIFILLVIVGTILDIILMILLLAQNPFEREYVNMEAIYSGSGPVDSTETDKFLDSEREPLIEIKREKPHVRVRPIEFFTAFSLFKTVPALLSTKQAPHVITSLNGLRVISMFWVILGHTHFWLYQDRTINVDNRLNIRLLFSRFSFQIIEHSFFAVDSFFFLSGVLVAYLVLREMKKRNGRFPFVPFYVHRYLRLTPTLAFVLFFAWFLTDHITYGPGLLSNPYSKACSSYWWTNLLYINNFYPWSLSEQCVGWTWYLANDMQLYVISPAVLIAVYHFLPAGLLVSALFLASGFIITGSLTGVYDFQSSPFSEYAYGYVAKPGAPVTYIDTIYVKPWDRIAPYIVGLLLGYVFYRGYKLLYYRIVNVLLYGLMWAIAAFVAFWLVFGLYFIWHGHVPTTTENVIYITFSRFLWAACMAVVVFACHNGYGWFINSFLSMKIWTPLARMTFSAYLVHPILLTVVYGQLQTSMHYTDITVATYAVAFVVLSYGVAALICLLVEFPLGSVETLVFKCFGSEGRNNHQKSTKVYFSVNARSQSIQA